MGTRDLLAGQHAGWVPVLAGAPGHGRGDENGNDRTHVSSLNEADLADTAPCIAILVAVI